MDNENEYHLISILMKELEQVAFLHEKGIITKEVHDKESIMLKEKIQLLNDR